MKFLIFSLITLFVSHISAQSYNISQLGLEQGLTNSYIVSITCLLYTSDAADE